MNEFINLKLPFEQYVSLLNSIHEPLTISHVSIFPSLDVIKEKIENGDTEVKPKVSIFFNIDGQSVKVKVKNNPEALTLKEGMEIKLHNVNAIAYLINDSKGVSFSTNSYEVVK